MIYIADRRVRHVLQWLIPLLLMPAAVLAGTLLVPEKRHLFVSFAAALLALLLFLAGIERRRTGTRRMVLTAVMIALCIAGRFIPLCKPVTAVIILSALYLGREAGFLTGAMAALLSNFFFGQGPWTAFQMLAWGMIGWLAGAMAEPLKRRRSLLLLYGALSGIAYSMVMDVWTVLQYSGSFDGEIYLAKLLTALPHTILYAAGNVVFLWYLAKPFGEKLERVRKKYGV